MSVSTARPANPQHPSGNPHRVRVVGSHVARGIFILIGLGPLFPVLFHDLPVLGTVAHWFDSWFEFQCHRDEARSLHLLGQPLPVCSRCLGIYSGLGLGALVLKPELSSVWLRIWVGSAAFVMILDVATEVMNMRPPFWPLRLFTGVLLAYPVAVAVVQAIRADDAS